MYQKYLNEHPIDWRYDMECKFKVTTTNNHGGVIAVIQNLTFRKNSTTDECIDYVQFIRKDGLPSSKYCGRFNAALKMDHNFINPAESIASGNSIVDENGSLVVSIFISKQKLKFDEEMDLNIVFTPYRGIFCTLILKKTNTSLLECLEVLRKDDLYKPCSNKYKKFCIYSGFFGDSYINCPHPDCVDEGGCSKAVFFLNF